MNLTERYAEPHRKYHTGTHIMEMLTLFMDRFDSDPRLDEFTKRALILAIWYHDAIYDPRRPDNEHQSALLVGENPNYPQILVEATQRLIESTALHHPRSLDEKILSDLDLAILGSSSERYDEYADQIREEYHFVPFEVYRKKRSDILWSFLKRNKIFFHLTDLEWQARSNICGELWELA